jgi:protein-disulfide isomerase
VLKRLFAGILLLGLTLLSSSAGAAPADDALLAAAARGDAARVEALLAAGADVNTRDVWGKPPLAIAAARGDIAVAQLLLGAGAAIDAQDNWRRTALIVAVQAGNTWLADILIHRGADVGHPAANGITALIAAAQRGNAAAAAMLIAAGAAVDRPDIMGWTPLMWAAKRGDRDLLALLLAAGARVNARDRDGQTVLDHAAARAYPPALTALLRDAGALPARHLPPGTSPAAAAPVPPPGPYRTPVAGAAARGPADAPVTIVEYTEFQCPYCRSGAAVVEEILAKYRGKVRLVLKHYPLDFHPMALPAALYFEALHSQDPAVAWRFYRRIFADQDRLKEGEPFLRRAAADLGADLARLDAALSSPALRQKIAAHIREADHLGLDGVPAFIVNGTLIDGAQPIEEFTAIIDPILSPGSR